MFEKRIVPNTDYVTCKFLDHKKYVLVNDFNEAAYFKFCTDCGKVLSTGQDFLPIVIDSSGGYVNFLFAMIELLNTCGVEVVTICSSRMYSAGAVLFSCGHRRYMSPDAVALIHDVSNNDTYGKVLDLENSVEEVSRLNTLLYKMLDKNTGNKKGYWGDLVIDNSFSDLYLTAKMSKKHGLATHVCTPHLETRVELTTKLVFN